jgi:hypothetical protein
MNLPREQVIQMIDLYDMSRPFTEITELSQIDDPVTSGRILQMMAYIAGLAEAERMFLLIAFASTMSIHDAVVEEERGTLRGRMARILERFEDMEGLGG